MVATGSAQCPSAAIVLAAGTPPASLSAIFGRTSSAMVPINGRPTIHWLLRYLREIGIHRVVLGLRATETRLPRFVKQAFGQIQDITFVPVSEDLGPGYTLLQCLKQLPADASCLVVLGDTLFEFSEETRARFAENFVLTEQVQDASRWCLAEVGGDKGVVSLADKPAENPGNWPALVGVYHFRDTGPARKALEEKLSGGTRSLQLRHALEPYIQLRQLRAYSAGEWFDCGNLDFLTSSRRRLLQARSFNTIQIDELRGTITKRSKHHVKFLNEINYYRLIPGDLATFFPRLVDFSLDPKDLYLTLEYYGYPTLSEVWVFEEFEADYWERLFRALLKIIECFGRYTTELSPAATFHFYWQKTKDRLAEFALQKPEFAKLVAATEIHVNDNRFAGWPRLEADVEKRVRELTAKPQGQIIHGDLCFPNILYDPVSRLFKFIDPRGSFADSGMYGDARYDVAKLLHSIDGGYDYLIHDMFMLKQEDGRIQLQQFFSEARRPALAAFERVFGGAFDFGEVRMLEGLLFLSMCPLHHDHPTRQTAMFATGLQILNEVLKP